MKIKKQKSGYTIKCTNGDFGMLQALAAGRAPVGIAKSAHTKRTKETGGDLFRVDTDVSNVVSNRKVPVRKPLVL